MAALPPLPQKYKAVVLGLLAVLVTVFVSAVYGSRGWVHLQRMQDKQRELEELAFQLQRENERLRDHLRRFEQDDSYIEKLARERLGWIKPGETVYRVRGSLADRAKDSTSMQSLTTGSLSSPAPAADAAHP